MRKIVTVGKPIHYKLKSGETACGIVGAEYAAYDPRDADCLRCRATKVFKFATGGSSVAAKVGAST